MRQQGRYLPPLAQHSDAKHFLSPDRVSDRLSVRNATCIDGVTGIFSLPTPDHPHHQQQTQQTFHVQLLHLAYPDGTNVQADAQRVASNRTRTGGGSGGGGGTNVERRTVTFFV